MTLILFCLCILVVRIDLKHKEIPIIIDTIQIPVDEWLYDVAITVKDKQIHVRVLQAENISKEYIEYWKRINSDPITKKHLP